MFKQLLKCSCSFRFFTYKSKFIEFSPLSRKYVPIIIVMFLPLCTHSSKLMILYLPMRYQSLQRPSTAIFLSLIPSATTTIAVSTIEIALTTNHLESIPSRELFHYPRVLISSRARNAYETQRALINQQRLIASWIARGTHSSFKRTLRSHNCPAREQADAA